MSLVCDTIINSAKMGMLKLTGGIIDEIKECQKTDLGKV